MKLLSAALVIALAACGDDDETSSTTTEAAAATTTPATTMAAATTDTASADSVPTVDIADACELVPTAEVASLTDLAVDEGAPDGDERRRVCTFRDQAAGVGITVGLQAGGRFDEKAEVSRQSLEVDGEEIDSLGDRALFFFSDEDLPEGVGGVLVGVGDLTLEVTMQGLDEDTMREASTDIAELAVSNL